MNAVLTRSKQNYMSVCWEPFATSTPVKKVPNDLKIEYVLQKQLLLHAAPVCASDKIQSGFTNSNVLHGKITDSRHFLTKRVSKNNSSTYFDVLTNSSSDEDESSENKKRPIIKLSSRKKTRSLLSINKSGSETARTVNKIKPGNELSDCEKLKNTSKKRIVSAVNDFKPKINESPNSRGDPQYSSERLNSSFRNSNFSSDEENRIFDETKCHKNSMNGIKSCTKNKENFIRAKKINENLDKKKQNTKEVLEITNIAAKSIKDDIFKGMKGSCKTINEVNKLTKIPKTKGKKIIAITDSIKKTRSRKLHDKAKPLQPIGNAKTPLHIWEKKHNLSHQLFSDSREQEFINMLDLTKEENNEAAGTIKHSRQMENDVLVKPLTSSHPSVEINNKIKQERPKRTKQSPKKFWLPESASDESVTTVMTKQKKHGKKKELIQGEVLKKPEETLTSNSNSQKNKEAELASVEKEKTIKSRKRKAREVTEEKGVESHGILDVKDIKLKDIAQSCLLSHSPSKKDRTKGAGSNHNAFAATKDGKAVNLKNPVFQRLNELSYTGNETGCSVGQCWDLHSFKCGVFVLKIKAQFAYETSHKNSHWGGVLVKGELRMKIGDKESVLKEGDMAFVPPLTKWQATNIGDCESVFYYWCGRFTS